MIAGTSPPTAPLEPGDEVRLKADQFLRGVLTKQTDGEGDWLRYRVTWANGNAGYYFLTELELAEAASLGPATLMATGQHGSAADLRGNLTYSRLSGRLFNLIYSLNTTNTVFHAYQFKPVLAFLDSPCNGILIADEVGLGKTIEAGLIWTEIRARRDARRLLVVCPSMLCEKWRRELLDRFGITAQIVDSKGLLEELEQARTNPQREFHLIASLQGIRPPMGWEKNLSTGAPAVVRLAHLLKDAASAEPLIDMMVIDEAHYLRNPGTQSHRLAVLFRPVVDSLVLLSATPIQLGNRDLFSLVHLLDPEAFPYLGALDQILDANAPLVMLRDQVLAGPVTQDEFVDALRRARRWPQLRDSEQLAFLIECPPSAEILQTPAGRAEIAEQLDRLHPLSKVINRTRKRDVPGGRVKRVAYAPSVTMNDLESQMYEEVTDAVYRLCDQYDMASGFMRVTPQRQMTSSMPAAVRAWAKTAAEILEADRLQEVYEQFGDLEGRVETKETFGVVQRMTADLVSRLPSFETLRDNDSKYATLLQALRQYERQNGSGRKVVLFSFFKDTLRYLKERLEQDHWSCELLYGGLDKQAVLDAFADPLGPQILLTSEVASEGVDLQFASFVINYDLPWNPARIEQRIGRIDRIGQKEEQIQILNLVYEGTIDFDIYDRLLDRLGVFEKALGSMELILGDNIESLSYAMLSHRMSDKERIALLEQEAVRIEQANRQQQQLEENATNLVAHGAYIEKRVMAAEALGRYIRGEDLYGFVSDQLKRRYPGTRITRMPGAEIRAEIELSVQGEAVFRAFLQAQRLEGRTRLLSGKRPTLLFENRIGPVVQGTERVTQDHPLVRFTLADAKAADGTLAYNPISAVALSADPMLPAGDYVFSVARWAISGAREVERLEFEVLRYPGGEALDPDTAERLINVATTSGRDWRDAAYELNHSCATELYERARLALRERFQRFRDSHDRENRDRIRLMIQQVERLRDTKLGEARNLIAEWESTGTEGQRRLLPAQRKKLEIDTANFERRIAQLRLKEQPVVEPPVEVCGGVIRVS